MGSLKSEEVTVMNKILFGAGVWWQWVSYFAIRVVLYHMSDAI